MIQFAKSVSDRDPKNNVAALHQSNNQAFAFNEFERGR